MIWDYGLFYGMVFFLVGRKIAAVVRIIGMMPLLYDRLFAENGGYCVYWNAVIVEV